jgi:hypothetical protein
LLRKVLLSVALIMVPLAVGMTSATGASCSGNTGYYEAAGCFSDVVAQASTLGSINDAVLSIPSPTPNTVDVIGNAVQAFQGAPCQTAGVRVGYFLVDNLRGAGDSFVGILDQNVQSGSVLNLLAIVTNGDQVRHTYQLKALGYPSLQYQVIVDNNFIEYQTTSYWAACISEVGMLVDRTGSFTHSSSTNFTTYVSITGTNGVVYNYYNATRNDAPCGSAPCLNGALYFANTRWDDNKVGA